MKEQEWVVCGLSVEAAQYIPDGIEAAKERAQRVLDEIGDTEARLEVRPRENGLYYEIWAVYD